MTSTPLSEQRCRTVVEHVPEAIVVLDVASSRFVDANENAARLFDMPRSELLKHGPVELSAPMQNGGRPAGELAAQKIAVAVSGGTPVFEWIHRTGSGSNIDCEVRLVRLPDDRRVLLHASITDISERKRMEAALRDAQAKFELVFRNCPEAISITTEEDGTYLEVNEDFERITGYTREEIISRSSLDVGMWADGLERQTLLRRLREEGRVVGFLARIRNRDGEIRTGHMSAEAMEIGGRRCLVIVIRDVTMQKRQEDELRLATRVFESTAEGILITDPAERIVAVNPAFAEMTGYSEEELRGKRPSVLASTRHDQAFFAQMWEAVHSTGRWQGELWNTTKAGEETPYLMTMSAVRDHEGDVINYVGVMRDISHIKRSQEQLEFLANYDSLTGLGNRNLFMSQLKVGLDRAARHHRRLALIFLDLDNFKSINDTLGHEVGDLLLAEVARRLKSTVRQEDVVCRLGGDEFTVYVEDFADPGALVGTAQRLVQSVSEPYHLGGHEVTVTASVGISIYPNDGTTITELVKNADTAMYKVKEQGRNGFQFFREDMNARAFERMVFVSGLRRALEREEFRLVYQPQVDLASGQVRAAECLLRWSHPDLGAVSPGSFIPVAEETGLIIPIGQWVFRQLCKEIKELETSFRGRVLVNISPRQLRQVDALLTAMQAAGISGERIGVEINERALSDDPEMATEALRRLKSAGVFISIDDFGLNHGALTHLRRFPVDSVKIDRSFVRDIESDPNDATMVSAIIGMAHSLKVEVVAEGVESPAQVNFLKERRCSGAQGNHFSRPLPVSAFAAWLSRSPS
ncbi:MAG TPA: EAL domain-containing protein [Burkholderiales bacterium]|nr:EAL domain-containing protein [Burkholderiales bacterium]